jgi:hypothetical protein
MNYNFRLLVFSQDGGRGQSLNASVGEFLFRFAFSFFFFFLKKFLPALIVLWVRLSFVSCGMLFA